MLGSDNIWPILAILAMHIANQKLSFDIFTVGNLQNIFMEHDLYILFPDYFWHKRKINNFDLYIVFLAIASNIPQQLKQFCGSGSQMSKKCL